VSENSAWGIERLVGKPAFMELKNWLLHQKKKQYTFLRQPISFD
jgi:hypothetical protein